jgi:hypothetical protein
MVGARCCLWQKRALLSSHPDVRNEGVKVRLSRVVLHRMSASVRGLSSEQAVKSTPCNIPPKSFLIRNSHKDPVDKNHHAENHAKNHAGNSSVTLLMTSGDMISEGHLDQSVNERLFI